MLMAHPSRVATRLTVRAFAGVAILSVVLALCPAVVANGPSVGGVSGLVSGSYARVATDDGAGLRLRSGPGIEFERITTLNDGDVVQILTDAEFDADGDAWLLVTDGANTAYAFATWLTPDGELTEANSSSFAGTGYLGYDTPSFAAGQSVTVLTDDGQGLRIRTGPSTGAEAIATLGDGDVVTIVDGPVYDGDSNGWYLVSDGSFQGYGFAGFLQGAATSSASVASAPAASPSTDSNLGFDTPSFSAGQSATVQTDDGGGLRMRSGPSVDSEVVLSLADGDSVEIINGPYFDASQNGWYAVSSDGASGFVFAGFLAGGSAPVAPGPATSSGYLGYDTPDFADGQSVKVLTDDGGGLRVRAEAATTGQQLATLGDGDVVTIISGPWFDAASNGWYLVTDGSFEGYAFAGFLTSTGTTSRSSSTSRSAPPASNASNATARFTSGDSVRATEAVNIRSGASISSARNGSLATGVTVEVIDGPYFDADGDDWYFVRGDGLEGFAMGEFLTTASSAASSQSPATARPFIYPVSGYTFTQAFGCSPYAFEPYNASLGCNYHNGIDLAASSYTPIVAAAAGTVTAAGWCDCGLGYYVTIDHGNGYSTTYGHMAEQPYVSVGQQVSQGETIGPVGSTGLSTGPHVHFVVERNGVDIDPLGVL